MHMVPLSIRECLAEALLDRNRLAEAEEAVRKLIHAREHTLSAAPPLLSTAAAAVTGAAASAAATAEGAAASAAKSSAALAGRLALSSTMLLLVRVMRLKGEILEAEAELRNILRDRKVAFGVAHPTTLEALAEV